MNDYQKMCLNEELSKGYIANKLKQAKIIKTIDYAIPLGFADSARDLQIDLSYYVWDYTNNRQGKPLNLLEAYCKLIIMEGIKNANY